MKGQNFGFSGENYSYLVIRGQNLGSQGQNFSFSGKCVEFSGKNGPKFRFKFNFSLQKPTDESNPNWQLLGTHKSDVISESFHSKQLLILHGQLQRSRCRCTAVALISGQPRRIVVQALHTGPSRIAKAGHGFHQHLLRCLRYPTSISVDLLITFRREMLTEVERDPAVSAPASRSRQVQVFLPKPQHIALHT